MIKEYNVMDLDFYLNTNNGNFSLYKDELINENQKLSKFEYVSETFYLCINLSNICNLNCVYCFNKEKKETNFDLNVIKKFIMYFVKKNPKSKLFIDVSGKGEPLLKLDKILEINKYCSELSKEYGNNIVLMFVTNGTLLTPKISSLLKENKILYGVSLDGNKKIQNLNRKNLNGKNSYDIVINNVKKIENREFLGCACTLYYPVFSLVKSMKKLIKYFPTISYKMARDNKKVLNTVIIEEWLIEYKKLTLFLIKKTVNNDFKYIKALLNGDDYFGKIIRRIILNQRTIYRCDAGISRFCLDDSAKIYPCPAAYNFKEFSLGNIDNLKNIKMNNALNSSNCSECDFLFLCGGECMIEQKINDGINKNMCMYKIGLIKYAIYFCFKVLYLNENAFMEIRKFSNLVFER